MKHLKLLLLFSVLFLHGCSANTISQVEESFIDSADTSASLDISSEESLETATSVSDNSAPTNIPAEASTETIASVSEATPSAEVEVMQEEAIETSEPTDPSEFSELFTSIYLPYANREQSWFFNSVKTFVESHDYACEITEPTIETIGEITVSDSNGDFVYFAFMPSTLLDDEIIMCVSFHQESSNSEVSISNYSADSAPSYDTYSTQVIGEPSVDVSSIEEQKNFLFN